MTGDEARAGLLPGATGPECQPPPCSPSPTQALFPSVENCDSHFTVGETEAQDYPAGKQSPQLLKSRC